MGASAVDPPLSGIPNWTALLWSAVHARRTPGASPTLQTPRFDGKSLFAKGVADQPPGCCGSAQAQAECGLTLSCPTSVDYCCSESTRRNRFT